MNIPDDAFFTLLEQALCDRGRETLQRTLYLSVCEGPFCKVRWRAVAACQVHGL